MNTDDLIDNFVRKINTGNREPLWASEVPADLRQGMPDKYSQCDWQIKPAEQQAWIDAAEVELLRPLPPPLRSLVMRYAYPAFAWNDLWLFGNTGQKGDHEWRSNQNTDYILTKMLHDSGYIQFARPFEFANHDAICFDTRRRIKSGECPVVWIDHEGILIRDKIIVHKQVAESFAALVQAFVSE